MRTPRKGASLSIKSLDGLHSAGTKLRQSQDERERFVKDPVAYLKNAGLNVPDAFAAELKSQAFRINEVLAGKHDPVAKIAVA